MMAGSKKGQHRNKGISLDGYVNLNQACKLSRLKEAIITRYCRQERFKAINVGRQWMIHEKDFMNWLRASRSGEKHKPVGKETQYISVPEAAEIADLSESILTRYCRQERFKSKNIGKQWMIHKKDFLKWLDKPRPVGNPNLHGN